MKSDLPPIDRDLFRSVMRRQASSVAVVTTAQGGSIHGMTATAFNSVCADPPTILIVINRSTRSHPIIGDSGVFVVNILGHDQHAIAERFAGKLEDQFDGVEYRVGETSGPILDGSAAHLECRVVSRTEVETHTLFIGRVVAGDARDTSPLIYHDGRYAALSECR